MNIYSVNNGNIGFSFSHEYDPFINLSYEDWLLREGLKLNDENFHLFLYRNRESVISGRFQVPWKEMNFKSGSFEKVTYVRRRSGGGCVYHDLGNWNYCILRKGKNLERDENLKLMKKIIKSHGPTVMVNERYDLMYEEKKVSGSAFKQTKDYSYHHGTLLIEAKLDQLGDLLGATQGWEITGHGIASKPSPVTNLRDHGFRGEFSDFVLSSCLELGLAWEELSPVKLNLVDRVEALQSNCWRWGECPKHEITFKNGFSIEIHKGKLTNASQFKEVLVGIELFSLGPLQFEGLMTPISKCIAQELGKILLK